MKEIPKIKKNLSNFLWTPSKTFAVQTLLWVSMVGWIPYSVEGAVSNFASPSLPFPNINDYALANYSTGPTKMILMNWASCSHASGIVNGHFSSTPWVNPTYTEYNLYSHASHGSHGSHGSHASW